MNVRENSLHDIRQLSRGELSLEARLGYVALLLFSSAMTVVIVSLWLTEPFLPARTQVAFGAMSMIGLSWLAFSLWVLSTRRPLFARDRVIAGRMAVAFTALFLAGAGAAVWVSNSAAAYGALITGGAMLLAALVVWSRARRRFEQLSARRAALSAG